MLMITLQVCAVLYFLRSVEPYVIVKCLETLLHISQTESLKILE
jgi:hypothetical protein